MKLKWKGLGNLMILVVTFIAPLVFGTCRAIFYEEELPEENEKFLEDIKKEKRELL